MTGSLLPDNDRLLDPAIVHLQTGGVGAMPRPVFDATVAAMAELERDPVGGTYDPATAKLDKVRAKAGELLGCAKDRIVLTTSATQGMFLVAQGLRLTYGDHILTTDHEHPGGRLGWEWVARHIGLQIDVVPIAPGERDSQAIVDRFEAAIRPRTRVLSVSHILYTTGVRLPVTELCGLAREHGFWSVIDGAQGPGAMPVDARALDCHAYAASGHKWLCGPKGTGLLYLDEAISESLDALPLAAGPRPNSDSTGISNIAGLQGLGAAIDYLQALGLDTIERHNLDLRAELAEGLSALPGVAVPLPAGEIASANLAFTLPDGTDLASVRAKLVTRHKIFIRTVDLAGFRGLRASLHFYNSSDEVQALIRALREEQN